MVNKLKYGQLALCVCPDWCEIGFMVARWNGSKFDYPEAMNDGFDSYVTAYLLLLDCGLPITGKYIPYN